LQQKHTYEAYYYKASFPIVLTFTTTSHKTQGATIKSKVLIDIKISFALGLTYVMLLRVTNCSNLMLQEILKPSYF
jgi:hypothetical protein